MQLYNPKNHLSALGQFCYAHLRVCDIPLLPTTLENILTRKMFKESLNESPDVITVKELDFILDDSTILRGWDNQGRSNAI